jgi:hypothetical protein
MHSAIYYNSRLRALSNDKFAQKKQKEIRGIKGVRGIGNSDLITIINEEDWPQLPQDIETLHQLYGTAHEDGLLALALLAVAALEKPEDALDLVERWIPFLDDTETTDFLGHLIIGPSVLATGESILERISVRENPYAIRAELMAALAALPSPPRGVCVAGLRRKFDVDDVIFVETPVFEVPRQAVLATMKMTHPVIQKALRQVIFVWSCWFPEEVEQFFSKEYPNWPNWMKAAHKKGKKRHNGLKK